jgi:hypothetical protein
LLSASSGSNSSSSQSDLCAATFFIAAVSDFSLYATRRISPVVLFL